MAETVFMPKLGLTMTEGLVALWHKHEGDMVSPGDLLFEVETDKLTNQVEADCSGILLKIIAQEGDTVPCKAPVAYIGAAGETIEDAGGGLGTDTPSQIPPQPEAQAMRLQTVGAASPVQGGYILATPAAKEMARQKGIDIALVHPTGPNDSIVMKDVEAFTHAAGTKSSPLAAKIAKELGVEISSLQTEGRVMSRDVLRNALTETQAGKDISEQLTGMRKTISRRMSESWLASPRVCFEMAVDCAEMIALREQLKCVFETKGLKLNYNHVIIRAVAQALQEYPQVNASLDGDTLIKHGDINIGLAVGVDNGLLVPNLKRCNSLGLAAIASGMEDLIRKAREGAISMDELAGGTFTITNLGMYGMRSFSPIINQPELAILGVNAMVDTPVVVNGQVVVRPIMNLNLVADHRVIDGVLAAKFLKRVVELLEKPALMLV